MKITKANTNKRRGLRVKRRGDYAKSLIKLIISRNQNRMKKNVKKESVTHASPPKVKVGAQSSKYIHILTKKGIKSLGTLYLPFYPLFAFIKF